MATRRPPGLRGTWDLTQPADAGPLTRPAEGFMPTLPSPLAFAPPAPPGLRGGRALPGLPAAPPPAPREPPSRPGVDLFRPTRPAPDFQATRPAVDFAPTRPLSDFLPTLPASGEPARAGSSRPAPAARPPALAPVRPTLSPPRQDGHWQLNATPGENLVLMPGQMHLGQHAASVRTLLGSCVAITLWHPVRRIGGMCHFLLPQRQRREGEPPDGRYGDEAVEAMVRTLQKLGTQPQEYVAHLYGGADTMSGVSAVRFNIGERNIEQGWALIDRFGFSLDGVDVGEDIPRVVSLVLATGVVTMRRGTGSAPDHLRS